MVEEKTNKQLKKHKILIIEDEALVARELKSRLTNMGCEVVGIAYGIEGIELARQTKPDLLLSDIHLKDGQDGIEMAQVIQAERDIPVVFLTAYSDEDTVTRAKEITLHVLAEGVETTEQVEILRASGCDFIQGYYYARPLPASQMIAYLNKENLV